jgi:hypothetical protein
MVSNSPSKEIDWIARLKRKTQQFIVYKKPTASTETYIGLE